jgi:hypothetical protein
VLAARIYRLTHAIQYKNDSGELKLGSTYDEHRITQALPG